MVSSQFTKDSDIDFLLVFESQKDLDAAKKIIYAKPLSSVGIDYILKTSDDFNARKDLGGACYEAYHYGEKL